MKTQPKAPFTKIELVLEEKWEILGSEMVWQAYNEPLQNITLLKR